MNERQTLIAESLKFLNDAGIYCPSAQMIARRAKLFPSLNYILSVTASLRSLERDGLVGRVPPKDQWDVAGWCLEKKIQTRLKEE